MAEFFIWIIFLFLWADAGFTCQDFRSHQRDEIQGHLSCPAFSFVQELSLSTNDIVTIFTRMLQFYDGPVNGSKGSSESVSRSDAANGFSGMSSRDSTSTTNSEYSTDLSNQTSFASLSF